MKEEKKNILIIDDETDVGWIITKLLKDFKYKVKFVDKGRKALKILAKNKIDIVFLDLKLPDVDGINILSTIRKKKLDLKVVVMTAFGTSELRERVKNLGAYRFLDKPLRLLEILDILKQIENKESINEIRSIEEIQTP